MAAPATIYSNYHPSPRLRPFVAATGYFASTNSEPARSAHRTRGDGCQEGLLRPNDPLTERCFPDGHTVLMLNLGDSITSPDAPEKTFPSGATMVLGPLSCPTLLRFGNRIEVLMIEFHPGQAQALLHVPAGELTGQFLSLDEITGNVSNPPLEKILFHSSPAHKVKELDSWLQETMKDSTPETSFLCKITGDILRRKGSVSVASLAQQTGLSRQHLTRRFKHLVGLTPKQFCRIARFHGLLDHALQSQPINWPELAYDFGYCDQAHLIAEFKQFTGLTPGEFFPVP